MKERIVSLLSPEYPWTDRFHWLEETGYGSEGAYGIHTANPVGRQNMLNIMIKNGWEVVK